MPTMPILYVYEKLERKSADESVRSEHWCSNLFYRVSPDWILCLFLHMMTSHLIQFTTLLSGPYNIHKLFSKPILNCCYFTDRWVSSWISWNWNCLRVIADVFKFLKCIYFSQIIIIERFQKFYKKNSMSLVFNCADVFYGKNIVLNILKRC